ncbi:Methyltransferase domain-containing protein [Desulfonauticus submarinus]|uniref:Methyltransferase domain-containing protein n=1 Tax=Desulfonauticus submarinus TaxID=206665 RepID=A0A1H0BDV9_9BACT|nr:class I SAM-dependent methyltransferase [Desulfonauticus submarinus]SDN43819.1 Methyltransferase domain-containing protein [Desulfonauticus submarinus]
MWTKQEILNYEKWLESKQGNFILKQEKRLLGHLISSWPRRKQSFIDLGCGPGSFLNFFWKSGFEVHGVDKEPEMLKIARKRTKNKFPLTLADLTHLPFDDNEFDFGALILVLEFSPKPDLILQEAKRVIKKGLLLAFLNKYSFYFLEKGISRSHKPQSPLKKAHWFSWLEVKRLIAQNLKPEEIYAKSILPLPTSCWKETPFLKPFNNFFYPPIIGAFVGVRIEFLKTATISHPLLVSENSPCPPI